ncbi:MAG: hypothetical protein V4596_11015 [Bdellovibrionota bacterium]
MKKILIAFAILASVSAYANSKNTRGQDGSGGGGICINDKCKLLAEAGFRLLPGGGDIEISLDVIEELNKMEQLLKKYDPIIRFSLRKIIGDPGDIQFVTTTNPSIVKKFLEEYKSVLSKNDGNSYKENFEIFAFTTLDGSRREKTYIIVDQYKKLSTRGKALLLYHEYLLRNYTSSLEEALRHDGALIDILYAIENNDWSKIDIWEFAAIKSIPSYIFGDLVNRKGPMNINDIFGDQITDINEDTSFRLKLSYSQALINNKYDARFSKYLKAEPTFYTFRKSNRSHIYLRFVSEELIKKNSGQIVFTKELFEKFLEKESVVNPGLIEALKKCNDHKDNSIYMYAKEEGQMKFPEAEFASCIVLANSGDYGYFLYQLFPYIQGIDLNIPGKLVCNYKKENIYRPYEIDCKLIK